MRIETANVEICRVRGNSNDVDEDKEENDRLRAECTKLKADAIEAQQETNRVNSRKTSSSSPNDSKANHPQK